jgi:hypothetical protein
VTKKVVGVFVRFRAPSASGRIINLFKRAFCYQPTKQVSLGKEQIDAFQHLQLNHP